MNIGDRYTIVSIHPADAFRRIAHKQWLGDWMIGKTVIITQTTTFSDIEGCYGGLLTFVEKIPPIPQNDTTYGDIDARSNSALFAAVKLEPERPHHPTIFEVQNVRPVKVRKNSRRNMG